MIDKKISVKMEIIKNAKGKYLASSGGIKIMHYSLLEEAL